MSDSISVTPSELKTLLTAFIGNKLPMLITGKPGIGKTDIVKAAANEAGADLIISHPVVDSPIDYKGLGALMDHADGSTTAEFLPFGNLRSIMNAKKRTVYFMDDLGQAPPAVQAAAMQLILERRVNGHKVSDEVVFIAATNRKQDRAGVSGILEPVKSRFAAIIELEPSVEDWVKWATHNSIPAPLIGFIQFRRELLSKFEPTPDIKNTPSPRTVASVGKILNLGLPTHLRQPAIAGAAGEGFMREFEGFLAVYENLPDPKLALEKPESIDIADDPAVRYALIAAVVDIVDKKTMENFTILLKRMPKEFSMLGMSWAIDKNRALSETKAFVLWAKDNIQASRDVMMGVGA